MSSATRIHLVRHGTTLLNRANRYRGRLEALLGEQLPWRQVAGPERSPVRDARNPLAR